MFRLEQQGRGPMLQLVFSSHSGSGSVQHRFESTSISQSLADNPQVARAVLPSAQQRRQRPCASSTNFLPRQALRIRRGSSSGNGGGDDDDDNDQNGIGGGGNVRFGSPTGLPIHCDNINTNTTSSTSAFFTVDRNLLLDFNAAVQRHLQRPPPFQRRRRRGLTTTLRSSWVSPCTRSFVTHGWCGDDDHDHHDHGGHDNVGGCCRTVCVRHYAYIGAITIRAWLIRHTVVITILAVNLSFEVIVAPMWWSTNPTVSSVLTSIVCCHPCVLRGKRSQLLLYFFVVLLCLGNAAEDVHTNAQVNVYRGTMCSCSSADGDDSFARADLTDDLLMHVFQLLAMAFGPDAQAACPQAAGRHFAWFRRTLPIVCKRWNALFGAGGKFPWNSVVISVDAEMPRRRRHDAGSSLPASHGVAGSSPPTTGSSLLLSFGRTSLSALPKLRSKVVVQWTESHGGAMQHLMLDLGSAPSHDFEGSRALDALLRAANRGARGLRTLRLIWPDEPSVEPGMSVRTSVTAYTATSVPNTIRGAFYLCVCVYLQQLHSRWRARLVRDVRSTAGSLRITCRRITTGKRAGAGERGKGFLAGTLPYLSGLTCLTRLSFTPKTFQFPVTVPALPMNLRALHLSNLWISRLPTVSTAAPQLTELRLVQCHLVEGLLASLDSCSSLRELRLDGSRLTDSRGDSKPWEAAVPAVAAGGGGGGGGSAGGWPFCPALRVLGLAECGLRVLPAAVLRAFPGLEVLDLSNNQSLGGAVGAPDAAARTAAAADCLPLELSQLTCLREVRLAKCGLTVVPAALLAVPSITSLDLYHNSLSALPLAPPWPSLLQQMQKEEVQQQLQQQEGVSERGLMNCSRLRELVVGELLVARAGVGELEKTFCRGGGGGGGGGSFPQLPHLQVLEVRGDSFEPQAVRNLLGLQRAAVTAGRPRVVVSGGEE
ncbi:hypothetical protein VOLCADRAFT_90329 [Volvox carteri f. nagariensis]|uniref:Uncharacterized protein n=1 Tax=Volvox carteri f. nagariensis TaxID=3068 RepID=D8TU33_VOLCA|nr:uncharacterized protein VOLCADRAFT_90329 [Volvox carteri f. nagariensis]EFJ49073.1 hypothetical protein VOLCADRAFT_90329 [Volvox carteri f. nagariensis]|eukprot:XP_002949970.1 hypothetical protein VOLCADRAFT_90329 [Volvox carteri f. nagariensis]